MAYYQKNKYSKFTPRKPVRSFRDLEIYQKEGLEMLKRKTTVQSKIENAPTEFTQTIFLPASTNQLAEFRGKCQT